ncbi:MAG: hypothetical protein EBQ57_05395 [Actinobacteria bacterium]|nr:hypothetical protein [Actinomycetota bacterium]
MPRTVMRVPAGSRPDVWLTESLGGPTTRTVVGGASVVVTSVVVVVVTATSVVLVVTVGSTVVGTTAPSVVVTAGTVVGNVVGTVDDICAPIVEVTACTVVVAAGAPAVSLDDVLRKTVSLDDVAPPQAISASDAAALSMSNRRLITRRCRKGTSLVP